jgi:hypothetical protein
LSALRSDIDPEAAADGILRLLNSVDILGLPPEERVAVATVQVEALDDWLSAYLKRGP